MLYLFVKTNFIQLYSSVMRMDLYKSSLTCHNYYSHVISAILFFIAPILLILLVLTDLCGFIDFFSVDFISKQTGPSGITSAGFN